MPEETLNSEKYWNKRFKSDWSSSNGPRYTFLHGETAMENLPDWFRDDVRRGALSWCDWGCAEGEAVALAQDRFPGSKACGVDFSAEAIRKAAEKFPACRFLCEDWLNTEKSGQFDVVFSSHTLEHFHNPIWILQNVLAARAAKYLVFLVPFRENTAKMEPEHFYRFTPENVPLGWNGWHCVHYRVINSTGGYWNGTQLLAIYGRDEYLAGQNIDLSLANMSGESNWLEAALRSAEQQIASESGKREVAEQKRLLQVEHDKVILERDKRLEAQLTEALNARKTAEERLKEIDRQSTGRHQQLETRLKELEAALTAERGKSEVAEQKHLLQLEHDKTIAEQSRRLETQLAEVLEQSKAAAERQSELEHKYSAEIAMRQAQEAENAKLRRDCDEVRKKADTLQNEFTELQSQRAELQSEITRLQQSLEAEKNESKRLKHSLETEKHESKRLKAAVGLLEACRDELMEMKQARSYRLVCKINRMRARLGVYPTTKRTAKTVPSKNAALPAPAAPPKVESAENRPAQAKPLKQLRIGAIMDTFSFASFSPECDMFSFRPDNWKELFVERKPDLLMVESAWNGNDGAWQYRVGTYSGISRAELFELVEACRKMSMPTVFWNKEDPPHFDKFIEAARVFDYVFTTDENCIPLYQEQCGHKRIWALPFAAQERLHNPVLTEPRDKGVCFAGTYYANRFADRRQQMDILFNAAKELDLDIYDRMHGNTSPGYQNYLFPEELRQFIRGRLEYDDMVKAYRRYKLFLNTNSVSDSKTMFSRRVFELLGCGSAVVSTPSDGIRHFFGDIVPEITDAVQGREEMGRIIGDDLYRRRLNARGVRLVMKEHTYTERLLTVCRTIGITAVDDSAPAAAVVVNASSAPERVLENLRRQTLRPVVILTAGKGKTLAKKLCEAGWNARATEEPAAELKRIPGINMAALWSGSDYYGAGYLADAAAAMRYSGKGVTGMAAVAEDSGKGLRYLGELADECFVRESLWSATLAFRPELAANGSWFREALAGDRVTLPGGGFARYGFEYMRNCPARPGEALLREIVL